MLGHNMAQQLVQPLVRGFTTSIASSSAAPALASKSSSGGLASMLGFASSRVDTPLSEALPAVQAPLKGTVPATAPKLETTSLDAGTKVAAIQTSSPVSTVALVVETGSAYETDSTLGASKVLEHMAFKATKNRTTFRLVRELEKIGATATAQAGREHVTFAISGVKINTPELVEILVDSVLNAKFNYWEVVESLEPARSGLRNALKQPGNVLTEVLHRAAYDGSLGQPLVLDPSHLAHVTNDTLREFVSSTFNPSKMVLAGVGIGGADLKTLANPLVSSAAASTGSKPAASYLGGSMNVLATSPLTYVALAFEAKGGLSDPKAAAAAAVVKVLLDEARSVLPRVSKESEVFKSVGSFAHMYKDTGLVGIQASAVGSQASQLVDAVVKKVEGVAKGVSDTQLKIAKQIAIANYKATLASTPGMLSIMAPQLLIGGKFEAQDFVSKVEGLSSSDISSFVQKAMKTAPTFVSYGDLSKLPRYDNIAKRFD